MRKRIEFALLALLVVAVVALVAVRTGDPAVDVRDIRPDRPPTPWFQVAANRWGSADYLRGPAHSPEELIRLQDPRPIVIGAVEGIARGRELYQGKRPRKGEVPRHYLVMRVRVSAVLRG